MSRLTLDSFKKWEKEKQKAYLDSHPHSKFHQYVKMGNKSARGAGDSDHTAALKKHLRENRVEGKASRKQLEAHVGALPNHKKLDDHALAHLTKHVAKTLKEQAAHRGIQPVGKTLTVKGMTKKTMEPLLNHHAALKAEVQKRLAKKAKGEAAAKPAAKPEKAPVVKAPVAKAEKPAKTVKPKAEGSLKQHNAEHRAKAEADRNFTPHAKLGEKLTTRLREANKASVKNSNATKQKKAAQVHQALTGVFKQHGMDDNDAAAHSRHYMAVHAPNLHHHI